jgi:hypothetical protein
MDGINPKVAYTVTQQEISNGKKWRVSVTSFDTKPGSKIPYTIRIDYPPPPQRHPFIWIGLGSAGLALLGVVAILGFKRLKSVVRQNC